MQDVLYAADDTRLPAAVLLHARGVAVVSATQITIKITE